MRRHSCLFRALLGEISEKSVVTAVVMVVRMLLLSCFSDADKYRVSSEEGNSMEQKVGSPAVSLKGGAMSPTVEPPHPSVLFPSSSDSPRPSHKHNVVSLCLPCLVGRHSCLIEGRNAGVVAY